MKRIIALVIASVWIAGCADGEPDVPASGEQASRPWYRISPRQAVEQLDELLGQLYGPHSRAATQRTVASIDAIGGQQLAPATRADDRQLPDSLYYLINFDDSLGFALMAADMRVQVPVLAITEKGNLSRETFAEAAANAAFPEPEQDDPTEEDITDYETFFKTIVGPRINSVIYGPIPIRPSKPKEPGEPQSPVNPKPPVVTYKYVYKCGPFLRTKWDQGEPFNNWIMPINGKLPPAGCIAVAVSQILNYYGVPQKYGNIDFHWSIINKVANIDYGNTVQFDDNSVPYLSATIFYIGSLCKTDYGLNGSSSTTENAKLCLEKLGYKSVKIHDSHLLKKTEAMLNNGKPVFMRGAGYKVTGERVGHAWVVDGYATREKRIDGVLQQQENNLIHCNLGWRGTGDGYYAVELIATSAPIDYDEIDLDEYGQGKPREDGTTYGLDLKIITYYLP